MQTLAFSTDKNGSGFGGVNTCCETLTLNSDIPFPVLKWIMATGFLVTRNAKEKKSSGLKTNSDESSVLTFWSQEHLERSGSAQQSTHTCCDIISHRCGATGSSTGEMHEATWALQKGKPPTESAFKLASCPLLLLPQRAHILIYPILLKALLQLHASSGSLRKERTVLQKIQNTMLLSVFSWEPNKYQ